MTAPMETGMRIATPVQARSAPRAQWALAGSRGRLCRERQAIPFGGFALARNDRSGGASGTGADPSTGLRPVPLPLAGEVFWTANGRPYGTGVRAAGDRPYGTGVRAAGDRPYGGVPARRGGRQSAVPTSGAEALGDASLRRELWGGGGRGTRCCGRRGLRGGAVIMYKNTEKNL